MLVRILGAQLWLGLYQNMDVNGYIKKVELASGERILTFDATAYHQKKHAKVCERDHSDRGPDFLCVSRAPYRPGFEL